MSDTLSQDKTEALSAAFSNTLISSGRYLDTPMPAPEEDLELFFAELREGQRILDAGCGWGRYVHRFVEKGLAYVGVDNSIEALKIARETNPTETFHIASYRTHPFKKCYFDGLWCCCGLTGMAKKHVPETLAIFRDILMPGGVTCIVMPDSGNSDEGLFPGDESAPPLWYAEYDFDEFAQLLRDARFKNVDGLRRPEHGSMTFLARA